MKNTYKYIGLVLVFLICKSVAAQNWSNTNKVYEAQSVSTMELAKRPVMHLVSNMEKGNYHMLRESFADKIVCDNLVNRFSMFDGERFNPGCFKRHIMEFEMKPAIQIGNQGFPDYKIPIEIKIHKDPVNSITANCESMYDMESGQYMIGAITFIGEIPGIICPPELFPSPVEPIFLQSQCDRNPDEIFSFIKLRNRENSSSLPKPANIIGASPIVENISIPDNFDSTVAFRQILFPDITYTTTVTLDQIIMVQVINPLYEACRLLFSANFCSVIQSIAEFILQPLAIITVVDETFTYAPGYVISEEDLIYNDMSSLFYEINDGDGVFQVPDVNGAFVPLSTGFFLDRNFKRITVLSNNNDILLFGRIASEYKFEDPIALTVSGKYVYVLDKGNSNVVVLQFGLNSLDSLELSFVGTTDFGLDLTFATDIASFESANENILYVTNPVDGSISRVILDKNTGVLKSGAPVPYIITTALNPNGQETPIGAVVRLESSLRNSSSGQNVIVATVGQDQLIVLSTDALSSSPITSINFKYSFPPGSGLISRS